MLCNFFKNKLIQLAINPWNRSAYAKITNKITIQNLQGYTKFLQCMEIGRNFFFLPFSNPWRLLSPLTQNVNRTYIRRPKRVQGLPWTSCVRSYYILCPGDWDLFPAFATLFKHWKYWNIDYFWDHSFITSTKFSKNLTFLTPWYIHVPMRIKG